MRLLHSKNNVTCSGLTEVLVRSDTEPAILALTESAATALKPAGVAVKAEERALYDSRSNGLAGSAVKDVKDAVRTTLAKVVRHCGQEFPRGHPVLLPWLVKYFVAMVNRAEEVQMAKTAYELRKGSKVARALPHFAEKIFYRQGNHSRFPTWTSTRRRSSSTYAVSSPRPLTVDPMGRQCMRCMSSRCFSCFVPSGFASSCPAHVHATFIHLSNSRVPKK